MKRIVTIATLAGGVLACGSDSPTDSSEPGPTNVVIVDADIGRSGWSDRLTVTLRNQGGSGTFRFEAYGLPTEPNGPDMLLCQSEPFDVTEGWEHSAEFLCGNRYPSASTPRTKWIRILSRSAGDLQYVETDRHDL